MTTHTNAISDYVVSMYISVYVYKHVISVSVIATYILSLVSYTCLPMYVYSPIRTLSPIAIYSYLVS